MKVKEFMNKEVTLKKKWIVVLMFVSVVFIALTITFALMTGNNLRSFQDAKNGYDILAQQCATYESQIKDLNTKITEMEYDSRIKDVYIEIANKETEEQKAYVKEYETYENNLKVQLALRGIETGDFTALDVLGEDFAKQYEELKKKETEIENEKAQAVDEAQNTGQADSSAEEEGENPWMEMYDGIKDVVGE